MALSIASVFYASVPSSEATLTCAPPATASVRASWSCDQMGDVVAVGKKVKQPQYRFRRWVSAWQATCLAYDLPLWSVWVPCHVCKGAVHAYQSDVDHLISRENDGASENGNLALTHRGCNRQTKNYRNATADVLNAFRAVGGRVVSYAGQPNVKGGQTARDLDQWWNAYERNQD